MRLAWANDLHLDFLTEPERTRFAESIRAQSPHLLLIGGDTGNAETLLDHLQLLGNVLRGVPIAFVLGNHDYYGGAIAEVRLRVAEFVAAAPQFHYLSDRDVLPLTRSTGLAGHDGWGDGRYGDFVNSPVFLNDFLKIRELTGFGMEETLGRLNALGDEAAAHVYDVLPAALARYDNMVFLCHVPPWREAAVHAGKPSSDHYAPFFACKALGDALDDVMRRHPQKHLLVLCGHTHGTGEYQRAPNIHCITGGSDYGKPAVQRVFDWPDHG
jgi:3',5'-cyclic AMP phosphodiesterase CpdA